MGMTLAQLKTIDSALTQVAPGKYKLTSVPKPHSAFEAYILQVCPNVGLSWIMAIGKDVSTSSYGIELRSTFNSMREKLEKVYGIGKTTDVLLPGSIWDEPDDFMMALIKKERFLMTRWEKGKGANPDSTVTTIGLVAHPGGTNKGYITLEYYFSSSDACDKEIASEEDDAL
jgi:hypothetical protein